jgi:hypothetical protein
MGGLSQRLRGRSYFVVKKMVLVFSLVLGLSNASNAFAVLSAEGQKEIDYLLGAVGTSGCTFYRNGMWYESIRAEEHLRGKYAFMKYSLNIAEDFIEYAATKSSMTGEPYLIKCGSAAAVPSAQWLRGELLRFRVRPRQ